MKTSKVIQLVFAGALAVGLNGAASAATHFNASTNVSLASTAIPTSPLKGGTDGALPSRSFKLDIDDHRSVPCVPEPSTYLLMLAGMGLIGFMSYRRQGNLTLTDPGLSGS